MHSTSQKRIAYGSRFWGVMDSFPRSTAQLALDFTARQNRRAETSPRCWMAVSTYPLSRSLLQNVERCTSTFLSRAAARVGAEAIPDLHQNAVLINEKQGVLLTKTVTHKGGQGTIGPLRRFFGDFLSLVKESYPSETEQVFGLVGNIVSVSEMNNFTLPKCVLFSSFLRTFSLPFFQNLLYCPLSHKCEKCEF